MTKMTAIMLVLLVGPVPGAMGSTTDVCPPEKPIPIPEGTPRLRESSALIRAPLARETYGVSGKGLAVAVIDTGIRSTHLDFRNRIVAQRNFVEGTGDATDDHGHGTHVSGVIAANGVNVGVAPGANIASLKVLASDGRGSWDDISAAMWWVVANGKSYNITVVNMSLGDGGNYLDDRGIYSKNGRDKVIAAVAALVEARIPVVVAAGNTFGTFDGKQGMSFPAILPGTISVGAVYDDNVGEKKYANWTIARHTAPDILAPYSSRLHETTSPRCRTDIFAPGSIVRSSSAISDTWSSTMEGTSMAAPMVAGSILLFQERYLSEFNELPTVATVEKALRFGSRTINDGDDEDDTVENTGLDYQRMDTFSLVGWSDVMEESSAIVVSFMRVDVRFWEGRPDSYRISMAMAKDGMTLPSEALVRVGDRVESLAISPDGVVIGQDGRVGRARIAGGQLVISASFRRCDLDREWVRYGISNVTASKVEVALPVSVIVRDTKFSTEARLTYSAKAGIYGRAKLFKAH